MRSYAVTHRYDFLQTSDFGVAGNSTRVAVTVFAVQECRIAYWVYVSILWLHTVSDLVRFDPLQSFVQNSYFLQTCLTVID